MLARIAAGALLVATALPAAGAPDEPGPPARPGRQATELAARAEALKLGPPPSVEDLPLGARAEPECLLTGSSLTPHPPIEIDGDEDFASPLAGVRGGSGTAADPYVISGWLIAGQGDQVLDPIAFSPVSTSGIRIQGTTKHVVIRGNVIGGTGYPQGFDYGISIGAANVTVEDNLICTALLDGIFAYQASDVTMRGNEVVDARVALRALESQRITITDNTSRASVYGVSVEESSGPVAIEGNIALDSNRIGVLVSLTDGEIRVVDNDVRRTGNTSNTFDIGIYVFAADGALIADNSVTEGVKWGFGCGICSSSVIERNVSRGNGFAGFELWDDWVVGANVVRDNAFVDNGHRGTGFIPAWSGAITIDTYDNLWERNVFDDNWLHGLEAFAVDRIETPGLDRLSGTTVLDNRASGNGRIGYGYGHGYSFGDDAGTVFERNLASRNHAGGLALYGSTGTFAGNDLRDNPGTGLLLSGSSWAVSIGDPPAGTSEVADNRIERNGRGLVVRDAHPGSRLRRNVMAGNDRGFGLFGVDPHHFEVDVDASNTVDGRPVLLLRGLAEQVVDWTALDPGFLGLIEPANVTVRNVDAARSVQGLLVYGGVEIRIEGGRYRDNEVGIDLVRTFRTRVEGADLEDHGTAIRVLGDARNTALVDNDIRVGDRGIDLAWSWVAWPEEAFATPTDSLIDGNDVRATVDTAIHVTGERATVRRNTVTGPAGYGVLIEGRPVTVEDNVVRGPGTRGIHLGYLDGIARRNEVSGFQEGITTFASQNALIEDNRLTGNGIGYHSQNASDGQRILRNVVVGNDRGIILDGEVENSIVDCNRVTDNKGEGIGIITLGLYSKVRGNLIERNGTGVYVRITSLIEVSGNRIAANRTGVFLELSNLSPVITGNDIVGNTEWGVNALASAGAGARDNWWGDASGPEAAGNPAGLGDRSTDEVVYRPWATAPKPGAGACGTAVT